MWSYVDRVERGINQKYVRMDRRRCYAMVSFSFLFFLRHSHLEFAGNDSCVDSCVMHTHSRAYTFWNSVHALWSAQTLHVSIARVQNTYIYLNRWIHHHTHSQCPIRIQKHRHSKRVLLFYSIFFFGPSSEDDILRCYKSFHYLEAIVHYW